MTMSSKKIFYEKPGFVVCWYDDELQAIVQEFESFQFWTPTLIDAYKEMHAACLQAVKTHHALKWLCLSSKLVRATPPEILDYIARVATPRLAEAGLKYYAQVAPGSAVARFSTKNWQNEIQPETQGQAFLANFTNESDARAWLQQRTE